MFTEQPGFGQATAGNVVIRSGSVYTIAVSSNGGGYTTPPAITVAPPSIGTQATATATMLGATGDQWVGSIVVPVGGAGYTAAPAVTIAPPNAQAAATAVTTGGAVTGFTINSGGAGYSLVPAVTIAPPASGIQATATANLKGGVVTGFTISNPGSGYTSPPAVTIAAPVASLAAGSGAGIIVEAEDPYGNVDTTFSGTVTFALASNPTGAALSGTATVAASSGVATFSGLVPTQIGTGDTIDATSPGLAQAIISPFTVNSTTATQLVVTTEPPGGITTGNTFGLVVTAEDSARDIVPTYNGGIVSLTLRQPRRRPRSAAIPSRPSWAGSRRFPA